MPFALDFGTPEENLAAWVRRTGILMSVEQQSLFVTMLWAIWSGRNTSVFQESGMTPAAVFSMAMQQWVSYSSAATGRRRGAPAAREEAWKSPEEGFFKVNTDAGARGGSGTGLGGLIRSSDGRPTWAFSIFYEFEYDVDLAEALALWEGMQQAVARSWVRHSGNKAAHVLAQYALLSCANFHSTSVPDACVDIVTADFAAST
ncbi:hypothetical protein ACS0TY_020432 [Phlomoides rotata]